jgi:hypothetical protein
LQRTCGGVVGFAEELTTSSSRYCHEQLQFVLQEFGIEYSIHNNFGIEYI